MNKILVRSLILPFFLIITFCSCQKKTVKPAGLDHYTITNKGIGSDNTADLLKRVDADVISLKPKLVIIMVGSNDVRAKFKSLPLKQFEANLDKLVKDIQTSGSDVMLLSPPPLGYTTISYPDPVNSRLDSAVQIINSISQKYNCMYVDINQKFKKAGSPNGSKTSMINNGESAPDHPDGLHVTKVGARFIAKAIYTYIIDNNKLLSYETIVCFGDSLTYGQYLDGAGTANGDTYPAFLYSYLMGLI
jgi:lysophospholipase L1-like esterase